MMGARLLATMRLECVPLLVASERASRLGSHSSAHPTPNPNEDPMPYTIHPTSAELDSALLADAIPAVAWHVVSLRLGYLTPNPIAAGTVADHYNANVDLIRRITGVTLDTVRDRRSPAIIDNQYLIDHNSTGLA